MKISENECKEISRIISKLDVATGSLNEYTPLMIFESEEDRKKVEKGISILKSKMQGIDEAECYDDMKKFLKIKKILKDFKLKQISADSDINSRVF